MPHPGHGAVDEQDREVPRLAARQRPGVRGSGEEFLAGLGRDDERVEVGEQPHPAYRPGGEGGVSRHHPGRAAVLVRHLLDPSVRRQSREQVAGPTGRCGKPFGEVLRGGGTVRVEIAADERGERPRSVERGDVGAGVGDLAAAVRSEAERPAVGGQMRHLTPARPQGLEGGHHRLTGPGPGAGDDRLRELVDGQLRAGQRVGDRGEHLLGLLRSHPHPFRLGVAAHRQGGQRSRPQRQVGRRHQMDRAARPERLDQGPVRPQGLAHIGTGEVPAPQPHGELGGGQDLRVRGRHRLDHRGRSGVERVRQALALHPAGVRSGPGHGCAACRHGPETTGPTGQILSSWRIRP